MVASVQQNWYIQLLKKDLQVVVDVVITVSLFFFSFALFCDGIM